MNLGKQLRSMSLCCSGAIATLTGAAAHAGPGGAPIDCAILLCLSGGWPPSAECAQAKAEFIRRITPMPVEPPLQIWRCPMGATAQSEPGTGVTERLFRVASDFSDHQTVNVTATNDGQGKQADIDISGSEFDFVRSVKVWNVEYFEHTRNPRSTDCEKNYRIELGSYGLQGEFSWQEVEPGDVPDFVIPFKGCRDGNRVRAVGVEWTDSEGKTGTELVKY